MIILDIALVEEELAGQVNVEEEEEEDCRSSATPTQDDNASPVNGEPVLQPHPRLTEVCSLAEPSDVDESVEGIPVPVGVGTREAVEDVSVGVETREAVEDVSDGDLNEDDGGGENDLENMVLHLRIMPIKSFSSGLHKSQKPPYI